MKASNVALLLASLLLVDCANEGNSGGGKPKNDPHHRGDITQNLSGMIEGQSWQFKAGHARPSMIDGNKYMLNLWDTDDKPCQHHFPPPERRVIGAFPLKLGTYTFNNHTNMTLVKENLNIVAFEGELVIDEIANEKMTGHLVAFVNDRNYVVGSFAISICSDWW